MTLHRILRPALLLMCWALPGTAQGPLDSASIARRAHALTRTGTGLHAFGPGYKATLGRTGVRLVPALGRSAPRAMPVRVATASIHRDTTLIWSDHSGRAVPQRAGTATVAYDRAPGIRERWRVRPDGLELSYVFATRPAGCGDLVVRLTLASGLAAEPMADGTVRLWAPGLGGVRIGTATGIDAAGATVRGALRVTANELELSLPGAFVDRARYPLVLDPLFGPELAVGNQTGDDSAPDAAYDASQDCYLVCWQEEFSALDVDIRAQRVDAERCVPWRPARARLGSRVLRPAHGRQHRPDRPLPSRLAARSDPVRSLRHPRRQRRGVEYCNEQCRVRGRPHRHVTRQLGGARRRARWGRHGPRGLA